MTPTNWSVVLLGSWNRAILTPEGISEFVFGNTQPTQIDVEVPMDGLAPNRVILEGTVVSAFANRLVLEMKKNDFSSMARALECGSRALNELSRTPVSAAGYNVRYECDWKDEYEDLFPEQFGARLADGEFELVGRLSKHTVRLGEGVINIDIASAQGDAPLSVSLNFHRDSQAPEELSLWLQSSASSVEEHTKRVLAALGIQ